MKIIATHPRFARTHEIIDRTHDRIEAEQLLSDYQRAYGPGWTVEIMDTAGDKKRDVVRKLRAEGLTHNQIADQTGIKFGYVERIGSELGREGLISARQPGKPRDQAVTDRNEAIAKLVESGLGPTSISAQIGTKYTTVRAIVHQLRRSGRLPSGKRS